MTLIDRHNHHLFQPLLYQVATAALSPADITTPIRSLFRGKSNVDVTLEDVQSIDRAARELVTDKRRVPYDFLVLATGARTSYFGHAEWEAHATGLKSIEDAFAARRQVLMAFERAELATNPFEQRRLMTFVLIGGGPTGVEMAGAIAELSRHVLPKEFRHVRPQDARIILVEAGPRLLPALSFEGSQYTQKRLEKMGVEVRLGSPVQNIDATGVTLTSGRIEAGTTLWCAGVQASPAAQWLGAESDKQGRVVVNAYLQWPKDPRVFVVGDTAHVPDPSGKPLPGLAPVAMQQGKHVAKTIAHFIRHGRELREPFRYVDKGNLATIGRSQAVGEFRGVRFTGLLAWIVWVFVHIAYLIGFRNRVAVLLEWAWAYVAFRRSARLITGTEPSRADKIPG